MDLDDDELEATRKMFGLGKIRNYKMITISGIKIQYDKDNVKILDSYMIKNKLTMKYILKQFLNKTDYKTKRTLKSWIREWKTHNRLYKLGLFKSHTKDCDLEENEKWYRLLAYQIIGRF